MTTAAGVASTPVLGTSAPTLRFGAVALRDSLVGRLLPWTATFAATGGVLYAGSASPTMLFLAPVPVLIYETARRLGAQAATIARLEDERITLATQVQTRADELDVATRMLAARAQTMTSVIDAVTEQSIIGTDRDGVIRVWNPGAEKMLGLPRPDVVRKRSIVEFHLPEELDRRPRPSGRRQGWPPWCTPPRNAAATCATGPTSRRTAGTGRWRWRSPPAPTTAACTPAGTSSART